MREDAPERNPARSGKHLLCERSMAGACDNHIRKNNDTCVKQFCGNAIWTTEIQDKLMVDTYGGLAPHGGGALSGKDGTKVDRSGAYMARYVAKNIVAAGLADACTVSLAYAIGQTKPIAVEIDTQESGYYDDSFLTEAVRRVFDFTPAGMIHALDLDKPFFAEVCSNCHFMHQQAAWEQTDKTEKLRMACAELEDDN